MCFSIYTLNKVTRLCLAAQNVQQLIDEGTVAEAFDKNRHGEAHRCVVAFDVLAKAAAEVADEHKEVSPFLRYRQEIMANHETAERLRSLVMNLWCGRPSNLSALFMQADNHHTRIALECVASYSYRGEHDRNFMTLAADIRALEESAVAS